MNYDYWRANVDCEVFSVNFWDQYAHLNDGSAYSLYIDSTLDMDGLWMEGVVPTHDGAPRYDSS